MNNLIDYRTIKLTALSPIHIKGKDIDYGQGFVKRDEQTAYSIDSNKLAEFLFNRTNDLSLVEKYVSLVERKLGKGFDNAGFFSENDIYDYEKNRTHEDELIESGVFRSIVSISTENQFIRDGSGKPYIPGTSIKGAIKTAVAYFMLEKLIKEENSNFAVSFIKDIKQKIDDLIKNTAGNKKRFDIEKSRFADELISFLFQNGDTRPSPNKDFFRAVIVKDTQPLKSIVKNKVVLTSLKSAKEEPAVEVKDDLNQQVGIICSNGDGAAVKFNEKVFEFTNKTYNKNLDTLKANVGKSILITEFTSDKIKSFEFIDQDVASKSTPGTLEKQGLKYPFVIKETKPGEFVDFNLELFEGETEFDISLDNSIIKYFVGKGYKLPFYTIDDLISIVSGFYSKVWQYEKEFFDSCIDNEYDLSNIKSFYLGNTDTKKMRLGWGTGITGMTLILLLKDDDRKYLRNNIFIKREEDPAPKSRRLIYEEGALTKPLGWMKIN